MLTVNAYSIVIYDVITVNYCKCILLYSPLNSYLYVHWILDLINIIISIICPCIMSFVYVIVNVFGLGIISLLCYGFVDTLLR